MAGDLSTSTANSVVNHFFRNTTYTPPTTLYVALFSASASLANLKAGTLTGELTDGTPARQSVAFAAPSDGVASNAADINFTFTAAETIRYYAIMDSGVSGAGVVMAAKQLPADKVMSINEVYQIAAGYLTITTS